MISFQRLATSLCIFLMVAPAIAATEGSYFAVVVNDIDTSVDWYESVLETEVVTRFVQKGRFKIVNLRVAGIFIELLEIDAAVARPDGRVKGLFKAGLLVDDLDEFRDQLPESIPELRVVTDAANELTMIQLLDPDGNIIQVMELHGNEHD